MCGGLGGGGGRGVGEGGLGRGVWFPVKCIFYLYSKGVNLC